MFQTSTTYELARSIQDYHLEIVEKAQLVREVENAAKTKPSRHWSLKFELFNRHFGSRQAAASGR